VADSIRRVVTGHGANGNSIVLSDGAVPHTRHIEDRGVTFFEVWNTAQAPASLTADESEPTDRPIVVPPSANGTIIRFCQFDPSGSSEPSAPFMHRTETVDYGIVVSGEITLLLDDGSESVLGQGDVVIQRGTDHAWTNRSTGPALVAFVLIDGAFSDELTSVLPEEALARVLARPTE
jgi:quercetin dioxygenase-like cupin family protein